MEMEYADYIKAKTRVSKIKNIIPQYIPSSEEIDELIRLTKEIRTVQASPATLHGRRYEYEGSLKFIEPGNVGEPYIKEETLLMYMLFIIQTAKPRNENDKQKLEYIEGTYKQMLKIKDPKEE